MGNNQKLDDRVLEARNHQEEIEALINEYLPFIKAAISKTLRKYIDGHDDVLTVGMLGFHEAMLSFEPSRGSFISYANLVIRNRVLDELRKENRQKHGSESSIDDHTDDEVSMNEIRTSIDAYENRKLIDQRRDDLVVYTEILKSWDMTLIELSKLSPKKKELLNMFQSIGKHIAENEELLNELRRNKRLPAAYILDKFKIDRKRLDRGRKYIIAVVELWAGDFESLKSFVKGR